MNLLVDASIWSLALKRRREDLGREEAGAVNELLAAVEKDQARLLGVVRQELLTGIKTRQQFENLREYISAFPDVEITTEDYVEAARLGNSCRAKGVATHAVDMLLCSVALREGWEIFTTDPDFERYAKILGMRLHERKP